MKPSTRERYAGILREHIDPRWGTTKLADISHSAVQTWVAEVAASRSAATTRKVHRVLSLVLAMAVKDDRLMRNPAAGASPRVNAAERMYLSHEQVHGLAEACGSHRLVVLFLAYTGVRFGEMAALRVGRLDLMRPASDDRRIGDAGTRCADLGNTEGSRAPGGADPPLPGR